MKRKHSIVLLSAIWGLCLASGNLKSGEVTEPPEAEVERLGLDSFYRKYLSVQGFPIVSSGKVSDFAFLEAEYLIENLLRDRPDLLKAMTEAKIRLSIMAIDEFTTDVPEHSDLVPKAYWDKRARGLGPTPIRPSVSVGEENLLGYEGDPYAAESIFVHEFAHAIHQMGINMVDPTFQEQLEKTYDRAMIEGLWKGKYAASNPAEYWAEGVQSWFDTNRENDTEHNHVNTREELRAYDAGLAHLIESIFGDSEWRYALPHERDEADHLVDWDRTKAPAFEWPPEVIAAFEANERGDDLAEVPLRAPGTLSAESSTGESGPSITLRFENGRDETVSVFWIGFDGIRRHYHDLLPGRSYVQPTFGSHLWVIVSSTGLDLGWIRAPDEKGKVRIPGAGDSEAPE